MKCIICRRNILHGMCVIHVWLIFNLSGIPIKFEEIQQKSGTADKFDRIYTLEKGVHLCILQYFIYILNLHYMSILYYLYKYYTSTRHYCLSPFNGFFVYRMFDDF